MSSSFGTSFTSYPIRVFDYEARYPDLPAAWTAWQMWQHDSETSEEEADDDGSQQDARVETAAE